mgnify:FL=1
MKENKKVEQQAEDILRAYADELDAQYADAFDAILAEDPDYQKNIERYGKRRYVKPQKRILRYAAILLVAIIAASVIVPVPQASAWRIWWLDLITGQSDVDMQVDAENEYDFADYYAAKIPDGFELSKDIYMDGNRRDLLYQNEIGKYIQFRQQRKDKASSYVDTEKAETNREAIGTFQVLVTYSGDDVIFEFTTECALDRVHTNAGYAVGKKFIESLVKK